MHYQAPIRAAAIVLATAALPAVVTAADNQQPAAAACTPVGTISQLNAIRNDPGGHYCLVNDIDFSARANFKPIGDVVDGLFTGRFDGKGFAIRNLKITSSSNYVGLFGITDNAAITNVSLHNVKIVSNGPNGVVGGLVGLLDGNGGASVVRGVHISGSIKCSGNCSVGGILGATSGTGLLSLSSSSAKVVSSGNAGGAVGGFSFGHQTINRTYATGSVKCTVSNCIVGGLVGRAGHGTISLSYATGPVTGGGDADSRTGGLIGLTESGTTVARSFAASPVVAGTNGFAAGLIAQHNSGGDIDQTYSIGPVSSSGAIVAGLIANVGLMPSITNSYWDTETSGQAASAAGTGLTTAQLRAQLPAGFGAPWAITKTRSYPFINNPAIDFRAPLATLVALQRPYLFLPISQLDRWEYTHAPAHADEAALAAVYTMIARAAGVSNKDARLIGAKIDKYFWDDATQVVSWTGPVKTYVVLGGLTVIADDTPLNNANVIGSMNAGKLVVLRGTYKKSGGTTATHWLLGTLYTRDPGNGVNAVVANDPSTGEQVHIDPATKKVIVPADFPLKNFKVNGYRPVRFRL
jgi:hypothetical protein